jgi:hypothetical protein
VGPSRFFRLGPPMHLHVVEPEEVGAHQGVRHGRVDGREGRGVLANAPGLLRARLSSD